MLLFRNYNSIGSFPLFRERGKKERDGGWREKEREGLGEGGRNSEKE